MSFAKVFSAETFLLTAHLVSVEVDISRGLHAFSVVGLPDKAVEEAKDRVSAAIKNSGFTSPKQKNQKVTISLAPADLKKEGPAFDLPMALAYLLAEKEVRFNPEGKLFLGELSLRGELRPVRGVLPLVSEGVRRELKEIFVPAGNAREAALVDNATVYAVNTLKEITEHLDERRGNGQRRCLAAEPKTPISAALTEPVFDLSDIKGQEAGKRGLEIAAAGGHNIALFGPPGTGKTMLARSLPGILPPLSDEEVLEVTAIHSVAGALKGEYVRERPFRAPHHTASYVSLVGGGTFPKPGEVTLAHRGVLFMDEFPEFDRRVIESLRGPLEDKVVSVARARGSASFPADFILIAALNPCPCGKFGSGERCVCLPSVLARYRRKVSGPIADRIDMWIEVPALSSAVLSGKGKTERESEEVRKKITAARARQKERFEKAGLRILTNSEMSGRHLDRLVPLDDKTQSALNLAADRMRLSARSYHRIIKLARTIADLEGDETVTEDHIHEALQYRPKQLDNL